MSTAATRRAEYVAALPTFAEAAALIMIDPSGVSRREHPDQAETIRSEIDACFASLPARKAADSDELIADLWAGLPPGAAEAAIAIYLNLRAKNQ